MMSKSTRSKGPDAREKLLHAALKVLRVKGYSATTVQDLCEEAGVTKGAFFHHFASKPALAVAAAEFWAQTTAAFFKAAPYHQLEDPLQRVLGYIEFRRGILRGELPEFTCLVGTLVQETYVSYPDIRQACNASITSHAATLVGDMEAAALKYGVQLPMGAHSLALHTQVVIQGAFVLAKAGDDVSIASDSIEHLRQYIELLFNKEKER